MHSNHEWFLSSSATCHPTCSATKSPRLYCLIILFLQYELSILMEDIICMCLCLHAYVHKWFCRYLLRDSYRNNSDNNKNNTLATMCSTLFISKVLCWGLSIDYLTSCSQQPYKLSLVALFKREKTYVTYINSQCQ